MGLPSPLDSGVHQWITAFSPESAVSHIDNHLFHSVTICLSETPTPSPALDTLLVPN